MPRTDGDIPLSDAASALDDRIRGQISDLTDLNVRKRKPVRLIVLWLMVATLAFLFVLITQPSIFGRDSDDVSEETETTTDADLGPLSGTWDMWMTNSLGSTNKAFTITFTGTDRGTLEVHEDSTERDTSFTIVGDLVTFRFTRLFDVPIGQWPETSDFEGTLVDSDRIVGEWARQSWECWPDPDAGCGYDVDWSRFSATLTRQE